MAIRYVGAGGSDSNDGLSWATRKLTLNGVEDSPIAAGDTVYVGPGVYRESLQQDVNGTDVAPIVYVGDVTGEHTDGVGGVVRITGSDNDQTALRSTCIEGGRAYRTYRGFRLDLATSRIIDAVGWTGGIIEDCSIVDGSDIGIYAPGFAAANLVIRRCIFSSNKTQHIAAVCASVLDVGMWIQNCIFENSTWALFLNRAAGVWVWNSIFRGHSTAINQLTSLGGQSMVVNNSIFVDNGTALLGAITTDIIEDYNNFWQNDTDRTGIPAGANSIAVCPLFQMPLLKESFKIPAPFPGEFSEWSTLRAKTQASTPATDLFGINRPSGGAKKSWGPTQFHDVSQNTVVTYSGSPASLKIADAGEVSFSVPVTPVTTVFSCKVYREADYAGTLPQMVISQPGQADVVVTDVGAAGGWNTLSTSLTPAATSDFVVVRLRSNNTATSGAFAIYFDDLAVS